MIAQCHRIEVAHLVEQTKIAKWHMTYNSPLVDFLIPLDGGNAICQNCKRSGHRSSEETSHRLESMCLDAHASLPAAKITCITKGSTRKFGTNLSMKAASPQVPHPAMIGNPNP